jgi:hypothetical protein
VGNRGKGGTDGGVGCYVELDEGGGAGVVLGFDLLEGGIAFVEAAGANYYVVVSGGGCESGDCVEAYAVVPTYDC